MTVSVDVYVGIGSNIDGPQERILRAVDSLDRLPTTRVVSVSQLYLNPPMGPADQPHYVNAVARLQTRMEPRRLLGFLQEIEAANGRARDRHWGPRTLDLDILTYGDLETDDPELTLPHPGIADRAFVLVPWAEIAPDLLIPGLGRVSDLRDALPAAALQALDPVD